MEFILHFKDGTHCRTSINPFASKIDGNLFELLERGRQQDLPIDLINTVLPDGSVKDIRRSFKDLQSVEILL